MSTDQADRPARLGPQSANVGLGLCVAAGTLSGLGDTMQSFALNWEATAFGAGTAGLVATLGVLPRVVLMLIGGAVADRYGIRRIMISCDAVMAVVLLAAVIILLVGEVTLPVIIGLALLGGAVSAFYLPASGGFVRLFVSDDRLPVVLPRVSGVQQLARLVGPALGAATLLAVGLTGTLAINLATFLLILVVLAVVRPPRRLEPDGSAAFGTPIGQIGEALRQCVRRPGMVAALGSLALVAGGVLPVLYLGVPLLARQRHWGAAAAGWIESAWIVGTLSVTVILAKFGAHHRMGRMIIVGPAVAAAGAALIAAADSVGVAIAGAVLMGVGTAIYTGHLSPLYLAWTPPELTARFQALFGIVQAVPMALVSLPYGLLAGAFGAPAALATTALVAASASLVAALNPPLRSSIKP